MKTKLLKRNRKSSLTYNGTLSAGLLLALVGTCFILSRNFDRKAVEREANSAESNQQHMQIELNRDFDSMNVKNEKAVPALPSGSNSSAKFSNEKLKHKSISKIQDQILEANPEFHEIWLFSEKVLPSKSDFKRVEAILSDRTLLRKFSEFLNLVPESNVDRSAQLTRIYSLNALKLAASWKENPARVELGEILREAFTQSLSRADMHEDLKRSLVADKFELWAILKANFPNIANEIRKSEQDDKWQKLIDAADKFAG